MQSYINQKKLKLGKKLIQKKNMNIYNLAHKVCTFFLFKLCVRGSYIFVLFSTIPQDHILLIFIYFFLGVKQNNL